MSWVDPLEQLIVIWRMKKKRGGEQNDALLERIRTWEDLMMSVFRNFNDK